MRFGDIAGFLMLLTPPIYTPILGVFQLDQIAHVGVMHLKLISLDILFQHI